MKRLFLLFAFASIISVAGAWSRDVEEGIVLLATKHLSTEAKSVVVGYLGDTYEDDVRYLYLLEKQKTASHTEEIHYCHLNSEYKPLKVEGDDAVSAMEGVVNVVRNHKSHSHAEVVSALRTMITLVCDMHDLGKFRIDGIPHSQSDFKFYRRKSDIGAKREILLPMKWSTFWLSYAKRHVGFSGAFWAEDMELNLGDRFADYSKGSLYDWVAENSAKSAHYLSLYKPDSIMLLQESNELEEINYDMMLRAGCRLAALLNETLK